MTSPGLIDRSISRIRPLTKLDTTFCRPNPIPTPIAPPRIAKEERSNPIVDSAMAKLITTRMVLKTLANKT